MTSRHRVRFTVLALATLLSSLVPLAASAQVKPLAVIIVPFDASSLAPGDQWMGEAVAQVLSRGLAQHRAFVQIERARLTADGAPGVWTEAAVHQAASAVHADVAMFGRVDRQGTDLGIYPRLLNVKSAQATSLPTMTFDDGAFATGIASLPLAYARALQIALTPRDSSRIEQASRLTPELQALKLFTQGQMATYRGAHKDAVDLLVRAIEDDNGFVVAHYTLGTVHAVIGNRWKAAAQFRAAAQLDSRMPEPIKSIGDLYLSQPRKLFEQAIEAYSKAIALRPFYADAYGGLGAAYAIKGLCAESAKAYARAAELDPRSARAPEPCASPSP